MMSADRCSAAYDGAADSTAATKIVPTKPAIRAPVIMDVSPIQTRLTIIPGARLRTQAVRRCEGRDDKPGPPASPFVALSDFGSNAGETWPRRRGRLAASGSL